MVSKSSWGIRCEQAIVRSGVAVGTGVDVAVGAGVADGEGVYVGNGVGDGGSVAVTTTGGRVGLCVLVAGAAANATVGG